MNDVVAVMRAADFAARKHATQRRKGDAAEPCLNHLIEVANLVAEVSDGRADVVVAALLHDVVEDQGVPIDEVAALFGPAVASIVEEVTDDKSLPKQVRKDEQVSGAHHKSDTPHYQTGRQDLQPARHRKEPSAVANRSEASLRRVGESGRIRFAVQARWTAGEIRGDRELALESIERNG